MQKLSDFDLETIIMALGDAKDDASHRGCMAEEMAARLTWFSRAERFSQLRNDALREAGRRVADEILAGGVL